MPTTNHQEGPSNPPFAFFVEDDGGWRFIAIYEDREDGVKMLSLLKREKHTSHIVALELPSGHRIYDWKPEPQKASEVQP